MRFLRNNEQLADKVGLLLCAERVQGGELRETDESAEPGLERTAPDTALRRTRKHSKKPQPQEPEPQAL